MRLVAVTHATAAFLQPVLAGSYLSGSPGAIRGHEAVAQSLSVVAIIQLLAATIYWRPGGGRGWPLLATLAIFGAEGYQIGLGYNRELAVHIPLGVSIVFASCAFAIWTFLPGARTARRRSG